METLLTVDQVADALQVPKQRLYAWRHEGRGPPAIPLEGRMLRWRAEDIESWLENQRDTPRSAVSRNDA